MWGLLGALASAWLAYDSQRRAERLARQQYQQTQQAYQQAYDQLYNMLSPILDPNFSAIPQSLIDQIVGRAAEDIGRLQSQAEDRALRDLARRGLAGSSLVDQRNVAIAERANQALTDARLQAQLRAQEMTNQIQSQARNLLAGLTSQNFGAMQQAAQGLIDQAQGAADSYASLLGNLISPYLQNWLYGNNQGQPGTSTQGSQSSSGFRLRTRWDDDALRGYR